LIVATVDVVSEIPGTVWKIESKIGDKVAEGDTILILESMKMEIPLQTTSAGVITAITVAEGDFVGDGDTVAALEI
jgi:acetyl-CoA carboxylase biotin carboxyl carrier protein